MGIIVPELELEDGSLLSNAYVSFGNEIIHTYPVSGTGHRMCVNIRVWDSPNKDTEYPLTIKNLVFENADLTRGPYAVMYELLKKTFPTGIDHMD